MNPRVGVGVLIEREKKLLLGLRFGAHGAFTWAPPGGHLEFSEMPEKCARREVLEETGLLINHCQRGIWTNDYFKEEQKHYITLFVHATANEGEPKVMEPDKCIKWQWFSWQALPNPLFLPMKHLLERMSND